MNQELARQAIRAPAHRYEPIILSGSGRSGTSWLAKIIECSSRLKYYFEPFHPKRGPEPGRFSERLYLHPDETHDELYSFLSRIFAGKLDNKWMKSRRRRLCFARCPLVKGIRMNLMLNWIHHHFNCRISVMVRHPCGVVSSTMRLGWPHGLSVYQEQEALMTDHLAPYENAIAAAKSPLQCASVDWCIGTMLSTRWAMEHGWPIVRYEDLCRDPMGAARDCYAALGLAWNRRVERFIQRSSQNVEEGEYSVYRRSRSKAYDWRGKMSSEEVGEVRAICEAFGLERFTEEDSEDGRSD